MKRGFILFVGLLLFLPGAVRDVGQNTNSEQYRVWSAYLRDTFSENNILVLMAELRDDPRLDSSRIEEASTGVLQAVEAYNLRLETSETVEDRFDLGPDVIVLTKAERDDLGGFGPEAFYRELFQKYPGTPGMIELSPVGFSQDSSTAVFFPVVYRGGLRCFGTAHLMEKVQGRWQVKEKGLTGLQLIC